MKREKRCEDEKGCVKKRNYVWKKVKKKGV